MMLDAWRKDTVKKMKDHPLPGLIIKIKQDNQVILEESLGYRNEKEQLPMTSKTVCGIASMTKSFTTLAVMLLQERGDLEVDDLVCTYLPELDIAQRYPITLHHLMSHTSGLPPLVTHLGARKRSFIADPSTRDYQGLDFLSEDIPFIDTMEEYMAHMNESSIELIGKPGERFSYSNDGFALLGEVIRRVTDLTYEEVVQQLILTPLEMKDTSFFIEDYSEKMNDVTMLYATRKTDHAKEAYEAPLWWDSPTMRAGGYLKSTADDILRYLSFYLQKGWVGNRQVAKEETIKEMMKPVIEISPGQYYGYGLMITPDYYGEPLIEHGGGQKGVSSLMVMLPERNLAAVTLTNSAGFPTTAVTKGAIQSVIRHAFHQPSYSVIEKESILPLSSYEGSYHSKEGMSTSFLVKNKQLYLCENEVEQRLKSIGQHQFSFESGNQVTTFKFYVEHEEVIAVHYHLRFMHKK